MVATKVFGVGLNKTGTTSLAEALRILGYRTLHFEGEGCSSQDILAGVGRAVREERHPFAHVPGLRNVDAFFDVRAVDRYFPALDAAYPGSRFILHTRPMEAWLASREKHVRRNLEQQARGQYHGGWLTVDVDSWKHLWVDHHDRVRSHFRGRPDDLLEIDVTRGDGWETLTPFLGCREPAEPFPWANRSHGTDRFPRLRRTGRRAVGRWASFRAPA